MYVCTCACTCAYMCISRGLAPVQLAKRSWQPWPLEFRPALQSSNRPRLIALSRPFTAGATGLTIRLPCVENADQVARLVGWLPHRRAHVHAYASGTNTGMRPLSTLAAAIVKRMNVNQPSGLCAWLCARSCARSRHRNELSVERDD